MISKQQQPYQKIQQQIQTYQQQLLIQQKPQQYQPLQSYQFIKTIGKGNFGKVKLAVHKITQQHVAIKILQKQLIFQQTDIIRISRQLKILKKLKNKFIVQLYQIIQTQKQLYLIMQYAQQGDLFDKIVKQDRFPQNKASQIFTQIALGMNYFHDKNITHRDLKPQNILLTKQGIVKIADFGLGNIFKLNQKLKTACGSPCYASPQMLNKQEYDPKKVDIWSSGIIMYAMVCGYLPFEDPVTSKLYQKIKNTNVKLPSWISSPCRNFIRGILTKDPKNRFNIEDVLEHELLQPYLEHYRQLAETENQISMDKIQDICQKYQIMEVQRLVSDLAKNRHNNLTTLFYLATKKQGKLLKYNNMIKQISLISENYKKQQVQTIISEQPIKTFNESLKEQIHILNKQNLINMQLQQKQQVYEQNIEIQPKEYINLIKSQKLQDFRQYMDQYITQVPHFVQNKQKKLKTNKQEEQILHEDKQFIEQTINRNIIEIEQQKNQIQKEQVDRPIESLQQLQIKQQNDRQNNIVQTTTDGIPTFTQIKLAEQQQQKQQKYHKICQQKQEQTQKQELMLQKIIDNIKFQENKLQNQQNNKDKHNVSIISNQLIKQSKLQQSFENVQTQNNKDKIFKQLQQIRKDNDRIQQNKNQSNLFKQIIVKKQQITKNNQKTKVLNNNIEVPTKYNPIKLNQITPAKVSQKAPIKVNQSTPVKVIQSPIKVNQSQVKQKLIRQTNNKIKIQNNINKPKQIITKNQYKVFNQRSHSKDRPIIFKSNKNNLINNKAQEDKNKSIKDKNNIKQKYQIVNNYFKDKKNSSNQQKINDNSFDRKSISKKVQKVIKKSNIQVIQIKQQAIKQMHKQDQVNQKIIKQTRSIKSFKNYFSKLQSHTFKHSNFQNDKNQLSGSFNNNIKDQSDLLNNKKSKSKDTILPISPATDNNNSIVMNNKIVNNEVKNISSRTKINIAKQVINSSRIAMNKTINSNNKSYQSFNINKSNKSYSSLIKQQQTIKSCSVKGVKISAQLNILNYSHIVLVSSKQLQEILTNKLMKGKFQYFDYSYQDQHESQNEDKCNKYIYVMRYQLMLNKQNIQRNIQEKQFQKIVKEINHKYLNQYSQ